MLALGCDKPCGSGVAFEVSPFLGPGRCWCTSWSSLKAGSAPLPHQTLLNTLNCCLTGYHPQCLLRKYLMTSAQFLSQTQQVRLVSTNRILISRTCWLYGGGWPQKGSERVIGVGRWGHILAGVRWCGPTNSARSLWCTACEGPVLCLWTLCLAGVVRVPLQLAHSS